jgi:predicted DNA-binding transcriptional regulator AlpA
MEKLLRCKDAAEMIGISPQAAKMRAYRGSIPSVKIGPRLLFKLSDIITVIDDDIEKYPIEFIPSTPAMDRLLTRPQVAEMLNMSPAALWDRFRRKVKPCPIGKINGRYMYRVADVVDAIDNPERDGEFETVLYIPIKRYAGKKGARDNGIKHETITAICPYCRNKFEIEVVKGSCRWIYCDRHQVLRSVDREIDFRVALI